MQEPTIEDLSAAAHFFMEEWPTILKPWGFTRTAGRVHGVLLVSPSPLNADELLASTGVSRGGLSTQLNALQSAGLVERLRILGQRQDRFEAVRDGQLIREALAAHWEKKTVQPMKSMEQSLAAIAGKDDLHWFETVYSLRRTLTPESNKQK